MKTKRTVSKHDIVRSIKALRYRIENLVTIFQMQQQEFKEYLEYKKETKAFESFLKEKYEREQSENVGSRGDTKVSEK
tara:strand:- start:3752 stop:3985 length:234 start_codon:yes stop_codon:yes gene_type:complete